VEALRDVAVGQVACGSWWSMAVGVDGCVRPSGPSPLPLPSSDVGVLWRGHRTLYCWGYGDGGWLGLGHEAELPFVEPGPPAEKFGGTCAFDSDFNALLPEVVRLPGLRVERVVSGAGHTIILTKRRLMELEYSGGGHEAKLADEVGALALTDADGKDNGEADANGGEGKLVDFKGEPRPTGGQGFRNLRRPCL
jgi:hypothetical protein